MNFLWPEFLWLELALPLLVVLYIWLMRRKKKVALRYASLSIFKEAMGPGQTIRRHIPPALFLLALAAMLIAAARPMAVVTLPSNQQTIILAMDVSGSMRATDVQPSRLVAMQNAAKAFLAELPRHVKVGIVAFAGSAQVAQLPTTNREDLVTAIDRFQLQRATATGNAIVISLATLFPDAGIDLESLQTGRERQRGFSLDEKKQEKKEFVPVAPGSYTSAAVIMLTDGQRTTGVDPLEAAKLAADRGVCVSTPWASARSTVRRSVSKAGRCACASTRRRSRRSPTRPAPNTSTPARPPTCARSTRPSARGSRWRRRKRKSPRCSPWPPRHWRCYPQACRSCGSTGFSRALVIAGVTRNARLREELSLRLDPQSMRFAPWIAGQARNAYMGPQ
jgi:Ca-activated chloride channel homolog